MITTAIAAFLCFGYRDATPEATVKGMFDALNNKDFSGTFSRVEGAKVDEAIATFKKMVPANQAWPKWVLTIDPAKITGDTATAHAKVVLQMEGAPGTPQAQEDDVKLHRTGDDWKIVGGTGEHGFFNQIVAFARDPADVGGQSKTAAERTVILSDFKQIALAVMMYANDHDDKLTIDQATLKAKLSPYLKNAKLWIGPDGKPLDVRFNPALTGKSISSIPSPATCVLLSLGPKGNLHFVQEVTVIAYCDGHVKMLNHDAAAKLAWK